MSGLKPRELTWTALLARWYDFARSSVALPRTPEGDAWRNSVAPIITLQAITFALAELPDLPGTEHALALDRARLQIDAARRELARAWGAAFLPGALNELLVDAEGAWSAAAALLTPPSPCHPRSRDERRDGRGPGDGELRTGGEAGSEGSSSGCAAP